MLNVAILKEEGEEPEWFDDPNSTQVGNFRQLEDIDEGAQWNVSIATRIFYQFIIPTGAQTAFQTRVKDGLITWMASRRQWLGGGRAGKDFTFNNDTFRSINTKAKDILLNSTLEELSIHPGKFIEPATYIDKDTGQEKEFPQGMKLENPKGFSFTDNVEDDNKESKTYAHWREGISKGKAEIDALQTELRNARGKEAKSVIKEKIKELEKSIVKAKKAIEGMKNFTFNDSVTLQEVLDNTAEAQRFYLLYSLDPDDKEAAIALGNLIAEEYVEWKDKPELFEQTYGISFENYEKEVQANREKYIKKLRLATKLREGIMDDNDEVTLTVKEMLSMVDLNDEGIYPIKVYSSEDGDMELKEIDNKLDFGVWLDNATLDEQLKTVQKMADAFRRYVLQPAMKDVGTWIKIEGGPRKPEEDREGKRKEFVDRPIKISKDDIKQYLVGGLLDSDTIKVPKKLSDKNLSNVKIEIKFLNKELPMEKVLARIIGGEHERVVGSKKAQEHEFRFNKVPINISHSQVISQEAEKMLPFFMAFGLHKEVRAALTAFSRRTASTTKEMIKNQLEQWFTRGAYGYLESVLEDVNDILEIQRNTVDIRLDLPEDFDIDFWITSEGNMKRTYNQFIKLLLGITTGGLNVEQVFLIHLQSLRRAILALDQLTEDYILKEDEEDEDEDIDVDILTPEELKKLTKKEKKAYDAKREAASRKTTDLAAAGEESVKEMSEEDKDEFLARVAAGESGFEDEDEEYEEEDAETELTDKLFSLDADRLKYASQYVSDLIAQYRDFMKYKKLDLSGDDFTKDVRKLLDLIEYPDIEGALKTLKGVSEKSLQSNKDIDKLKEDITNQWDKVKENFKIPNDEDFIRLMNQINLEDVITDAIYDSTLNDARHAIVSISTKDLNLVINTKDRKLELKGKILWSSKAQAYLDYKTYTKRGGYSGSAPTYQPRGTEKVQAKRGAKVTYGGKEQMRPAIPYDEDRFEFFKRIRARTQYLVSAVKG